MPKDQNLQTTVATMRSDILRHLSKSLGKDEEHASTYDWRMAMSLALRDLAVDPWFASTRKTYEAKGKRVYYLSMEFLIGRLIEDVAVNLGVDEIAPGSDGKPGSGLRRRCGR